MQPRVVWHKRRGCTADHSCVCGAGLAAIGAQTFLTMSLERVEAAVGMGMTYTAIIWSELFGIFIFDEIPNTWAVVGTVVVLYSSVHSGFVQARSRKAPVTPSVAPRSPCSATEMTVLSLKP